MSAPEGAVFPAATAVSRLRVYDWPAPDGVAGGSPHLHTASAEGYVVVGGHGAVQALSRDGYTETPLEAGVVAWFSPGTVHRLVNADGALDLVVVMQNAGLPEAGDAVLTFPPDVLADPAAYAAAAALPTGVPEAEVAAAARRRRDLALTGYAQLRAAVERDGAAALVALHAAAAALVADRASHWRELWRRGPSARAAATGAHLTALAEADPTHLARAGIRSERARPGCRFGMCGHLQTWSLD